MMFKKKKTVWIIWVFFLPFVCFGQTQSVDVKTLPKKEIQKAQNAIQEAGLSTQEAMELARQRGATQEQLNDFQQRLNEMDGQQKPSETATQTEINDPVKEAEETVEEQQQEQESTRTPQESNAPSIFGAYLFNSKNLTFEPSLDIQTPKNYEIGIGDQLLINIWGNSQNNYQLTVNPNGQILIPDVGPVYIAGETFESASRKIIERLTAIYADMGGNNPETFAQVNMGRLRSVRVNLVGEVNTPGTYTLPVTATVFNALYLSGGPNNIGSFRNISIIRDNNIYKTIDLYKFLVDANVSENVLIHNDDIIYIPAASKRVTVTGEFKRNGLFEIKEGENLDDLIRFAGGFTDLSYLAKIQVKRKTQQGFQILDIPFEKISSTPLFDGDEVSIRKILDLYENRVTITGSATRPGEYEWVPGMKLSELIAKADSIYPDAFLKKGHIIRYNPDLSQQLITFNLKDVLTGLADYTLEPEDIVTLKSHFEMLENNYISVTGHVMAPGNFPFMDSITVSDAIYLANGLREGAIGNGHVIRMNPDRSPSFMNFNVDEVMNGSGDFFLQKEDIVNIKSYPQLKGTAYIQVSGEVKNPSQFDYMDNMTLRDALYLANGFTEGADSSFIQIARRLSYEEEARVTDTLVHLYSAASARDLENPDNRFLLQPYDHIYVRKAPGYQQQGTVSITGEVKYAGYFAISQKGQRISDLVKMAGGTTSEAFIGGATLTRTTPVLGTENVAIDLGTILQKPANFNDIYLRNGDHLNIPKFIQTVKITGSVQNPFSITYQQGKPFKYYINKTGGFGQEAQKRKAYVRYANGATSTTRGMLFFKNYPKVEPGSTIVVPKKPERDNSNLTATMLAVVSTLSTLAIALSQVLK